MGVIVGIDLGTTNSLIATVKDGEPILIPNDRGKFLTPSVVGFTESGELLVGEPAKNQAVANPERTVSSIKRHMGTDYTVTIMGKEYTPQEISAIILRKLKLDAEAFLGEIVDEAVITVPAYFTDAQRQATKDAGEIAGFKVERIINEPTAAALAYGYDKEEAKILLVYDLGGGTFDVSILKLVEGAFKVLASHGNNNLGGDDFDYRIVEWLIEQFKAKEKIDLRNIPDVAQQRSIMQRLKEAAEQAKIELSTQLETTINLPFLYSDGEESYHLNETLTRAKFEEMIGDLVESTAHPVELALSDAGLEPEQIEDVLLVGGSTRIPLVQRTVKRLLGRDPRSDINPEEVVAIGAAIQAGIKRGLLGEVTIVDVAPFTLGIETENGRFSRIIPRNTAVPCSRTRIYRTVMDNQTEALIHVLQGESDIAAENASLGEFVLSGIPPKPAGQALVEVQFDYDINGIVKVTARDMETGAQRSITLKTSKARMSQDDLQLAQRDVSKLSGQMIAQREKSQIFFEAENLLKEAQKILKRAAEGQLNISPMEKTRLEELSDQLRQALMNEQEAEIDELISKLTPMIADYAR